jgi:hypothetical protein
MDNLKEIAIDGVIGVQQTVRRFREDSDYINTPFGKLNGILLLMGGWSFITILFSSLFHYSVSTGFPTYALSWIYFLYTCLAAQVLNKQQEPIMVGLVIGAGAMLAAVSFTDALLFYSLSGCTEVARSVDRWACTPALKSVLFNLSVYEFCYFIFLGALVSITYVYKDIILAESSTYVEVGGSGGVDGLSQMEDTPLTYHKKNSPNVAL